MGNYVYICDLDYGDYIYYDGSTWVVDERNYYKGTVTITSLGGHVRREIGEYTLVEREE